MIVAGPDADEVHARARNHNLMQSPIDEALRWFANSAHGDCMTTTPETSFHYEVKKSEDENKWKVTTITCHGRLVSDNADQIKELVKPLVAEGGRIVIDFADLKYLDSLGLGALVGLKVSAINKGMCKLELVNLSARVRELLSLTNLTELFSR
jgi:anti-anti-sigma factor